jgi:hypothetical protein
MDGYRSDDSDEEAKPSFMDGYRKLGPVKFWSLMAIMVGYTIVGTWFEEETGWPDNYGFHCAGKGCLVDDMWHSPALLQHPGGYQIGLFLWIWFIPAVVVGFLVFLAKRRRSGGAVSSQTTEPQRLAPLNVGTPSVFAEEDAAAARFRKILILLVMAAAVAVPLIAIFYYKGA